MSWDVDEKEFYETFAEITEDRGLEEAKRWAWSALDWTQKELRERDKEIGELPMTDYKRIRGFKNLADKVNETLDKGENGDLLAIVQELLDYNEKNREAIIAECRDIDSKENQ